MTHPEPEPNYFITLAAVLAANGEAITVPVDVMAAACKGEFTVTTWVDHKGIHYKAGRR